MHIDKPLTLSQRRPERTRSMVEVSTRAPEVQDRAPLRRVQSFTRGVDPDLTQQKDKMEKLFGEKTAAKIKAWVQRAKGRVLLHNAKSVPPPSVVKKRLEEARLITAPALEYSKESNTIGQALQAPYITSTDGGETNLDGVSGTAQNSNGVGTGTQIAGLGGMAILGALATAAGVVDTYMTWKEGKVLEQRLQGLSQLAEQLRGPVDQRISEESLQQLGINTEAVEKVLGKKFADGISAGDLAPILPPDMLESSAKMMSLLKNEKTAALKSLLGNKYISTSLTAIKAGADMTTFIAKLGGDKALAGVAGPIVGGITLACIGTYGMFSDGRAAYKARQKENLASEFMQEIQRPERPEDLAGLSHTQKSRLEETKEDLKIAAEKVKQSNRKSWKLKLVSFAKNAFLATAGVLGAVAAITAGAAALATPVGWAALAIGAVGFGIAIGLAAKGVKDARAAKDQGAINQANRDRMQTVKDKLNTAVDKLSTAVDKRQKVLEQIRQIKSTDVPRTSPREMVRLKQKLQVAEKLLGSLDAELGSLEAEIDLHQNELKSLDQKLMQSDVKYRAEKVLTHLQRGPEIARAKAQAYLQQVLGFKEGEIDDLRNASRGITIPLLSARMA